MESPPDAVNGQGATRKRRQRQTSLKLVRQIRSDGQLRWMISGLYVDGKRKREFFASEESAKLRLKSLQVARTNLGTLAGKLAGSPELVADAGRAADLIVPFGLSLLEVAKEYAEARALLAGSGFGVVEAARRVASAEATRRASVSLLALGERFYGDPETRKRSPRYLQDSRLRWRRFMGDFGEETPVSDITAEALRRWLAGLEGLSDLSRGNFHRNLSAVFSYAVEHEFIPDNPWRRVKKPIVVREGGIETFTPGEMRRLLNAAAPAVLPVLAIAGFAGIRPEEITRLDWSDIDLERRFIQVLPETAKTNQRRLVHVPDNLRAWLAPLRRDSGPVSPPNARKLREAAKTAAGIDRWPQDVLRHSFASYHLAAHRDLNETALQLGHRSTQMLFQHYREAVSQEAAREWWAIFPREGMES